MIFSEESFDAEIIRRAKAQIDIIPENGRVASLFGERTGDNLRMRVAFKNLEFRLERGIIQRVGNLAQTAADIRNNAAFAQFAPDDETFPARCLTDVFPETENF